MAKPDPKCTTCRVKNCSVLKNCTYEILQEISNKKKHIAIKKGDRLLQEGDSAKYVYFIRSGVARVELNGRKGRPLILRLASEGSIFGHRVKNIKDKQPLSIVAAEDTNVCYIGIEDYRKTLDKSQHLQDEVMKSLLDEMRGVEMRTVNLAHVPVKERIANTLLHIATIYHYKQAGPGIRVHLDRQDIADLAGTTKEQVSKILADLQKQNLIKFRAKVFKQFDLEGLQKMASLQTVNE
jgi:CRP-like cAMP-binding protein